MVLLLDHMKEKKRNVLNAMLNMYQNLYGNSVFFWYDIAEIIPFVEFSYYKISLRDGFRERFVIDGEQLHQKNIQRVLKLLGVNL